MRAAAAPTSSCSHTRMTCQPASHSSWAVSWSRAMLEAIFRGQYHEFTECPLSPWVGHPCQKQPSTNTATRFLVKTISARRFNEGTGRTFTRYRNPERWSRRRSLSSGSVSVRRTDCIRRRTPGEDANGSRGSRPLVTEGFTGRSIVHPGPMSFTRFCSAVATEQIRRRGAGGAPA